MEINLFSPGKVLLQDYNTGYHLILGTTQHHFCCPLLGTLRVLHSE